MYCYYCSTEEPFLKDFYIEYFRITRNRNEMFPRIVLVAQVAVGFVINPSFNMLSVFTRFHRVV